MSNVTGQRTRHLVAGTLDPFVRLLIFNLRQNTPLFVGDNQYGGVEKATIVV